MAADCSQHVVQPVTGPLGVVDVVGRHHRRVHPLGHPQQSLHQPLVARMELALKLHKKAVLAKAGLQVLGSPQRPGFVPGQQMLRDNTLPAAGERDQPGVVLRQIIPRCARLALLAAHPCSGDELAEIGIAGVVLGEESRVKVNLPLTPGPSPPGGEGNRTSDILSLWERVGVRVRLPRKRDS